MPQHEKASRQKQGEVDQKQCVRQKEPKLPFDQSYGWQQDTDSIAETPFRPRMEQHATLLATARSDEGRANLVLHLQQTYGNQYVQRLLNSMALQAKLTGDALNDICEQEGDRSGDIITIPRQAEGKEEVQMMPLLQRRAETEGGIIARTPAASKGTITISPVKKADYNVTGNNLEEVSAQLDPEEWGRCVWEWTQSYRTTEGVTDRVNINLKLTIRLPRWTGRGWRRASAEEKAEWNRMLECLQKHEDRHAEIARSWAPTLQERLLNQPESDIATLWSDGLAEHQDEQDSYDADTRHGETEGVTLDTSIGQPAEEAEEVQMMPLLECQAQIPNLTTRA
jgi:hypothetical protein